MKEWEPHLASQPQPVELTHDSSPASPSLPLQPQNMGASLSRNAGMAQSFGDLTVLLDDDVVPQPNILDAYLGRWVEAGWKL